MNYNKKTVLDVDVSGKKVLLRCDFNVPQDKETGEITSDKRIVAALPTIRYLLDHGAAVIACSHLGKPEAKFDKWVKKQTERGKDPATLTEEKWKKSLDKLTLAPVAKRLSELLGKDVIFAHDVVGEDAKAKAAALKGGEIMLLENTRFEAGETKNDPELAKALASMAELYVSDAFGTVHRAHASTAGVAAYLPAVSGLLVAKELEVMGKALDDPKRPFVAVLGGAKVSDKIAVINNLLDKADTVIIGGGMAYTFAKAQGGEIGKSLLEEDKCAYALEMIEKAKQKGVKLLLPVDTVAATEFAADAEPHVVDAMHIPADMMGMDMCIRDRAWTSAPRPSSSSARRPRARARSCGTAPWAFLSSQPLRPARRPWPRRSPRAARSRSSAAATARRQPSSSALPTRSRTSPPAAARRSSSWKARNYRALRAF